MKNPFFNAKQHNHHSDYLSGWSIALENYQHALQDFKKIEPRPRSEWKILRFKQK
ncbi:MAG: hypothetical protein OHK0053_08280 [Microscillaceae bacterium]